jgi:hypothetical protein
MKCGPRCTYFGKLLELLLKQSKVDVCKPSFQARQAKDTAELQHRMPKEGQGYSRTTT